MKRYILSALFGILPVLFSAAQSEVSLTAIGSQTTELKDGDTFTALTEEGVEMTFKVISASEKTCQVGGKDFYSYESSINNETTGTVTIPETVNGFTVTTIGCNAFFDCNYLANVVIPASVVNIEENGFSGCRYGLTTIILPEGLESIGQSAFQACFNLKEINLPQSLRYLGNQAFYNCQSLTSINIPTNVTQIGGSNSGCSSLKSITVADGNLKYDSRNNCNAIIETNSNTLIMGCVNTIIPQEITSIEACAFTGCKDIKSITIPKGVKGIGFGAFSGCSSLSTVISFIEEPFALNNVFDRISSDATLYVPKGTKALYEATEGWKQFANIVEMGGEEETPAEAIDLGLPSGLKWASWNVGASNPEEYGDYYAWGETETKEEYTKENYAFYQNGSYQTAIGNIRKIYGTSNYDISKTEYDVAYVKWGENWRMPTLSESQELSLYCTWEETTINNVKVNKVTGPNGNYIYLPFAGSSSSPPVWNCHYTTSTRMGSGLRHAFSGGYSIETGFCVRPVSGDFVEIREVRTRDAVDITDNTARLVGFATSDVEGLSYIGFYYSTSEEPTAENSTFIQASIIGSYGDYNASINNLTEGTTYYYRAVYVDNNSQYLGDVHYFKTTGGDVDESTIAEAVDLGLSVKWASWNIGASRPEGFGGYYAWGETNTKKDYTWDTYLCNEDNCCTSADPIYAAGLWGNGIQGSEYDVAHVKWGGKWRMPKPEEILELLNSCTWTMTTQNDVEGYQVTAANGNSIFIPAAGYRLGTNTAQSHEWANYWSSYPNSFGEECASEFTFWYQNGYRSIFTNIKVVGNDEAITDEIV